MPTTKYLWDDETDSVVMEKDGSGTTQAVYTTEPEPFGRLVSMRRNNKTYNYVYDGLGSTAALADENGQITDTYRYDAWGNERAHTGTTINPYRFVGEQGYQYNETTSDYYVRERVYAPKDGRWRSRDPLGFVDGLNGYVYAGNGPQSGFDPSGMYNLERAAAEYCRRKCKDEKKKVAYARCIRKCLSYIFANKLPNRQELFNAWYRLEKADMGWLKDLPKCPCCDRPIPCVCDGPDEKVWTRPEPVKKVPLNEKTFDPLRGKYGFKAVEVSLHPGAVTEIRTKKANEAGAGNQCTYDKNHRLITGGDGAGTADRRWFGGGILGAIFRGGHVAEDLTPAIIAYYLDGLGFGANMKKYLEVRPPLNDPDCDENIVPKMKAKVKKTP